MDPGTDRVGVVGLGAMGRPMTEHLLRRPDTPVAIHGRARDPYAEGCPLNSVARQWDWSRRRDSNPQPPVYKT